MDVWIKIKLHKPSITTVKTVSFIVTPVMRTCSTHDVGYRQCGSTGKGSKGAYCIRDQFFCDGYVNCANKHALLPSGKITKMETVHPMEIAIDKYSIKNGRFVFQK